MRCSGAPAQHTFVAYVSKFWPPGSRHRHASTGVITKKTSTVVRSVACCATAALQLSRMRRAHGFEDPSITPSPEHARNAGSTKNSPKSCFDSTNACHTSGASGCDTASRARSSSSSRVTARQKNCPTSSADAPSAFTPKLPPGSRAKRLRGGGPNSERYPSKSDACTPASVGCSAKASRDRSRTSRAKRTVRALSSVRICCTRSGRSLSCFWSCAYCWSAYSCTRPRT